MNADGSGIRTLVKIDPDQWSDYGPTWSPDGKRLLFDRGGVGDLEGAIFVVNADGSGLERLQGTMEGDDAPAWSPDGTKIVLARSFDYDCPPSSTVPVCPAYEIFVMNPDGSGQVRLTNSSTDDGVP